MNKIENILFDLDGTLTDPREGIVNSILYALEKLGLHENSIAELLSFIGPPLRDSFANRYNLTNELADKAMNYYREYYSVKGIFENKIYPGVELLLQSLSSHKYKLYVATSKPTVYAIEVLRYFKIDTYFTEIIGSNLDNTRTDKTEIISHILSTYGLQAGNSVMIGDRKHDIIGAKNNSVRTIGLSYGYGSSEELLTSEPDFLAKNCKELETLLIHTSI
ncbi:MAG: HAD family hydrolase [Bacteroidota bacterium]